MLVPIEEISAGPNPRRGPITLKSIENLTASIKQIGVVTPITVITNGAGYEIVAGHRRHAAAKAAGLKEVPAYVVTKNEAENLAMSLAENEIREPLPTVDKLLAYQNLANAGWTLATIAQAFGATTFQVRRTLSLASLQPKILELLAEDDQLLDIAMILTSLSFAGQNEWLDAYNDPDAHWANSSHAVRRHYSDTRVCVRSAIFDLENYTGQYTADLFTREDDEERLFTDVPQFWILQRAAINALAQQYTTDGWAEVLTLENDAKVGVWETEPLVPVEQRLNTEDRKLYRRLKTQTESTKNGQTWEKRHAAARKLADLLSQAENENKLRPHTAAEKAASNVYINLHTDGRVDILEGRTKRTPTETRTSTTDVPAADKITRPVAQYLNERLCIAGLNTLLKDEDGTLALKILCMNLSNSGLGWVRSTRNHYSEYNRTDPVIEAAFEQTAGFLSTILGSSDARTRLGDDNTGLTMAHFDGMSQTDLLTNLSALLGLMIVLNPDDDIKSDPKRRRLLKTMLLYAGTPLRDTWTPGAVYFSKLTIAQLEQVAKAVGCTTQWNRANAAKNKKTAVQFLTALFDPAIPNNVSASSQEKIKHWIPKELK